MKEKIISEFNTKFQGSYFDALNNHDQETIKQIITFMSQALDEYVKPKCDKCFDKGYRTELKGVRDLGHIRDGKTISDFSGNAVDSFTSMEFCSCDRGKELEKNVKEYADWKIKELFGENYKDKQWFYKDKK